MNAKQLLIGVAAITVAVVVALQVNDRMRTGGRVDAFAAACKARGGVYLRPNATVDHFHRCSKGGLFETFDPNR